MFPLVRPYTPAALRTGAILALSLGLAAAAGAQEPSQTYTQEIESWRATRLDRLTADDGWLTLIGLFWLSEGENRVGSAPESAVPLRAPRVPSHIGSIDVAHEKVTFRAAHGALVTSGGLPVSDLELSTDRDAEPTLLDLESIRFFVIQRGGRLAVRARDRNHPARRKFAGIETYAIDPSWRISARLVRHDPPRVLHVPTVLGTVEEQVSPGTVEFEFEDRLYHLDVLPEEGEELFLVFSDATSGVETYGGGRFVYASAPDVEGRVTLDFNKAYNPPCAFTDFATCPLPPRSNRLPFRVEAGEKTFSRPH